MNTQPTAKYAKGYRFKVAGYKHQQVNDLELIITYVYHNGNEWKYHVGLIIGKAGSEVLPPYTNCASHDLEDIKYVDYVTAPESEINYITNHG